MYSQSHLKRILPRKEEQHFRTEFPSHYYSSSSVYSYSPTSSSDCPEHGRSHRRTKIILTISVTIATLGVLSIAGVAVYLGFISKNINNGSHLDETYLYPTAVNSKAPASLADEDLFQMPNGRSRSDFYPDDPIDLTNRLEEPIFQNHPPVDPYLDSKHSSQVFFSQRNASASPFGNKFPTLIQGPGPTAIPSPVIVTSERIKGPSHHMTPPGPIDLQSPLIILAPKRNKSYTQGIRSNERLTAHFEQEDSTKIPRVTTTAHDLLRNETMLVTSKTPQSTTTITSLKAAGSSIMVGTVSDPNDTEPERPVENKQLPFPSKTLKGSQVPVTPTPPPKHGVTVPSPRPTIETTSSEGFYPVNPNYKLPSVPESESAPGNLMESHRAHLTFDRISPEFYDKKPWTPLLIRPTQILDKRPRIDGTTSEISTLEPILEERYYGYGSSGSDTLKAKPQGMTGNEDNNETSKGVDKDAIGHGNEPPISTSDVLGEMDVPERKPIHFVATNDRLRPIPAYTVTIPHIPNNASMITTGDFLSMINEAKENRMGTSGAEISDLTTGPNLDAEVAGTGKELPSITADEGHAKNIYADDAEIGDKATGSYDDEEEYDEADDDEEGDTSNERSPLRTRVYTLDPANTDMVPVPESEPLPLEPEIGITASENSTEVPEVIETNFNTTTEEALPSRSRTNYILSTLGSLNLVKANGQIKSNSNEVNAKESFKYESPLFPPTRSYVSVHLPLREKPSESDSAEDGSDSSEKIFLVTDDKRKLRLVNGEGKPLAPDLTSTSSLNKVLSMMMTFEESGNPEAVMNLLKNNVQLVVANQNQSEGDHFENDDRPKLTKFPGGPINKTREHKSFIRDPKIDSRFRDPQSDIIPVPLLPLPSAPENSKSTGTMIQDENKTWIPTKLSSLTLNKHNSPVYKFVLRKGQSVEDLLKEIFKNYTDKGIGIGNTASQVVPDASILNTVHSQAAILDPDPLPIGIQLATKFHVLGPSTTRTPPITTTVAPPPRTTIRISTNTAETFPTTTIDSVFKTSTSVVVNEERQEASTLNGTFKCASTGVVLSAFARCNSIKECSDNSDEKNCKCVDYLKSQLLHRKICDGIVDCADESDESYCDWCSPGQYICSGSRVCVAREKICDSRRDCPRGDDEANCVKIGPSGQVDDLEDISPIYHQSGYLMVRKKGVWGKLCVETFSSVLSHWEIKDLARAVCKAKTFSDFESVEKVVDIEEVLDEPYYELYNSANDTDSGEKLYSSDESTPRSAIGFKNSKCATRMVVKVKCADLQCGTAPRAFTQAARIVGGSNALPGGWPWQAALYRDGEYQCGATLISGRWLLSAGHCFYHAQDDYWVARLGTLRRGATFLSPYEQVIKITHIFLHPQYKDIGFINDVSLLRLEKEVNFTDFVRPVCLPEKDTKIRDGRICTVVGWGQLFETGRVFPDTLQEVQLPLISTSECRKRTLFLPLYKLTDEMFCAGFDRGGRDACLGDSGGPLMCPETDGRWSLYGVTSNGYGCARANRPGVYTKTKSYLDWVYDKISQDSTFTYRDKTKRCAGHRCLLGECLEPRSVCNGIADCVDGSDERNCSWS